MPLISFSILLSCKVCQLFARVLGLSPTPTPLDSVAQPWTLHKPENPMARRARACAALICSSACTMLCASAATRLSAGLSPAASCATGGRGGGTGGRHCTYGTPGGFQPPHRVYEVLLGFFRF